MTAFFSKKSHQYILLSLVILLVSSFLIPVYAQQTEPSSEKVEKLKIKKLEKKKRKRDVIVVTGSHIKRNNEFNTISPLQVFDTEKELKSGAQTTAGILQKSTIASGTQVDSSFGGLVLDNGPDSATIQLRGIQSARTLSLLNGRRLAPLGIGGAPSAPDANLIPTLLIARTELLLDGTSSIYGSDAIAGTINYILRKDFDGFNVQSNMSWPLINAGQSGAIAVSWGANNRHGFIGIGGEYRKSAQLRRKDVRFYRGCEINYEEDQNGRKRTVNLGVFPDQRPTQCAQETSYNWIQIRGRALYYTPGATNVNIPDYSDVTRTGIDRTALDLDGDGRTNFQVTDNFYNANGYNGFNGDAEIFSKLDLYSTMAYGEYNLDRFDDMRLFFEAGYSAQKTERNGDVAQFWSNNLPARNPFNPCNTATNGGITCPAFADGQRVLFVDYLKRDRSKGTTDRSLLRSTAGFKGNLSFLTKILSSLQDWTYESSLTYSKSTGTYWYEGINENRIVNSLNTSRVDPNNPTKIICGDPNRPGTPFGPGQCVPVNPFSPSVLYQHRLTPEEAAYLYTPATFKTVYEMTLFSTILSGDLFKIPGTAEVTKAAFGIEYRYDTLDSQPNAAIRDGNLFHQASDKGARGSKDLYEAFFEIDTPLISNKPFLYNLETNLSARYTREQFYGGAWTYSTKLKYQIFDYLTLRGTYGTSFRAPNLREQFLRGQTGFSGVGDPCIVPGAANNGGSYDPTMDQRNQNVLDNCRAAGVDPTTLGLAANPPQVEILSGGSKKLDPETSKGKTIGIVFQQPWFDSFNLNLSATYYSIFVKNSISSPGANFIVDQCYTENISSYCSRIGRRGDGFIDDVDASFINIGHITAKGIDYNALYTSSFAFRGNSYDLSIRLIVGNQFENNYLVTPGEEVDEDSGEPYSPKWTGSLTSTLGTGDWAFLWSTVFTGRSEPRVNARSSFVQRPTCLQRGEADVCRNVQKLRDFFLHSASVTWAPKSWSFTFGVSNIFDDHPPFIDAATQTGVNVLPGYDLLGRRIFAQVSKQF